jgi:hypothetical protein
LLPILLEWLIQAGIGPVANRVPKIRERGQLQFNALAALSSQDQEQRKMLPWLHLKGVSTDDFQEALQALLGRDARPVKISGATSNLSAQFSIGATGEFEGELPIYY